MIMREIEGILVKYIRQNNVFTRLTATGDIKLRFVISDAIELYQRRLSLEVPSVGEQY